MKAIFAGTLTLLLCLAFGMLVGVSVVAPRLGIGDVYPRAFFFTVLIAGGVAALFGPILAPGLAMKLRLRFAAIGAVVGTGLGALTGYVVEWHQGGLALATTIPVWGGILGLWLGLLRGTPIQGMVAGVLILGAVAGLGLYIDHPDPAGYFGAAGGLLAATLLWHSERRRGLLWSTRGLAAGGMVAAGVGLILLAPRVWPRMRYYDVVPESEVQGFPWDETVLLSPDGKRALGVLHEGVYLWDVADGRVISRWKRHPWGLYAAAYPADEAAYSVAVTSQGTFTRWEAVSGKKDGSVLGEGRLVDPDSPWKNPFKIALTPDGRKAAIVNPEEGRLWVVDFEKKSTFPLPLPQMSGVAAVAWCGNDRVLLAGRDDGTVRLAVLEGNNLRVERSFRCAFEPSKRLVVSGDGRYVCLINARSSAPEVLDLHGGEAFRQLDGTGDRARAASFSPDGRSLLWVDGDGAIHVWDLAAAREVRTYRQHRSVLLDLFSMSPHYIHGVVVGWDGRWAMSFTETGKIRIWGLDHR